MSSAIHQSPRVAVPETRLTGNLAGRKGVARLHSNVYIDELGCIQDNADQEAWTIHGAPGERDFVIPTFTPAGQAIETLDINPRTIGGFAAAPADLRAPTCADDVLLSDGLEEPEPTPPADQFERVLNKLAVERALSSDSPVVAKKWWLDWRLISVATIFLSYVAFRTDTTPRMAVIWIAVILFHEFGHFVAMQAFGYRNVRMFFVPFLGAFVTGKREHVSGWQEALVSLAGPAPGILLGSLMWAFSDRLPPEWTTDVVRILIVINLVNLLPIGLLDGSQFFSRALFARWPRIAAWFRIAAGIAMLVLGVAALADGSTACSIFALMMGLATVGGAFHEQRIRIAARGLRGELGPVDQGLAGLEPDRKRLLFQSACDVFKSKPHPTDEQMAATMTEIFDSAATEATTVGQTLALLSLYGLVWLTPVVALVVTAIRNGREWPF